MFVVLEKFRCLASFVSLVADVESVPPAEAAANRSAGIAMLSLLGDELNKCCNRNRSDDCKSQR